MKLSSSWSDWRQKAFQEDLISYRKLGYVGTYRHTFTGFTRSIVKTNPSWVEQLYELLVNDCSFHKFSETELDEYKVPKSWVYDD